jgi:phage shock protein PspC (stress-responsive transcriptional regulator)
MPERLTKSADDQVVDGVAGGLAQYFHVDPVIVRLAFVLLAFLNPVTVLVYIALMVVMPEPGEARARLGAGPADAGEGFRHAVETVETQLREAGTALGDSSHANARHRWLGIALVVGGFVFLAREMRLLWWFDTDLFWPAALILIGIWLVLRRRP